MMIKRVMQLVPVVAVAAALVLGLPARAQDGVTISFAHIFGGEQDTRGGVVQAIADAYMAANPGVTIEVTSPSGDYTELFNGALLAAEQGNAPTLLQVEEGLTQLAVDSTYFTPIYEVASEEQLATLDDLLPTVRGFYTLNGNLYSMPWNASNPVLYYNKGMFEAAGLDPASPPKTFAEVTAACEAIMAIQAELEITGCINFPVSSWFVDQWLAMQNALYVNNDNGRTARPTETLFTSEAMLNIMRWWDDLAAQGYFTYSCAVNDLNAEGTLFLSKGSAMSLNSTAGITLIQTFARVQGIDLGVSDLPIPSEDATNGVTMGGGSLWISASATPEQQQAAADFAFFLTSTENDITWHKGSGYFPIRTSSIEALTEEGWFEANPNFFVAINQLQQSAGNIANAGAVIGPSSEVRAALLDGIQSMIDGDSSPEDAMAAAKERADAVLADYNAVVGG